MEINHYPTLFFWKKEISIFFNFDVKRASIYQFWVFFWDFSIWKKGGQFGEKKGGCGKLIPKIDGHLPYPIIRQSNSQDPQQQQQQHIMPRITHKMTDFNAQLYRTTSCGKTSKTEPMKIFKDMDSGQRFFSHLMGTKTYEKFEESDYTLIVYKYSQDTEHIDITFKIEFECDGFYYTNIYNRISPIYFGSFGEWMMRVMSYNQ